MEGQSDKHILLVEDEPVLQRLIAGYLVAAGYVVQTAIDGLDAIAKLRAGLPQFIISDLRMPRMDGFEFLHVVHKRFPQIPVVLMRVTKPQMRGQKESCPTPTSRRMDSDSTDSPKSSQS